MWRHLFPLWRDSPSWGSRLSMAGDAVRVCWEGAHPKCPWADFRIPAAPSAAPTPERIFCLQLRAVQGWHQVTGGDCPWPCREGLNQAHRRSLEVAVCGEQGLPQQDAEPGLTSRVPIVMQGSFQAGVPCQLAGEDSRLHHSVLLTKPGTTF